MAASSAADPASGAGRTVDGIAAGGGGGFEDDGSFGDAIVADMGTGTLRIGYAGAERPKLELPCVVGRLKHPKVLSGGALDGKTEIIGSDAHAHRGVLRLSRPFEHGAVSDWADAERLWRHALGSSGLGTEAGRNPILVTERALTSRPHREALVTQLFEEHGAPAVAVAGQAPLALYGTSSTTGLVVDAGEGCVTAVPVYEGVSLPHATGRADVGGRDVTAQLMRLLRIRGLPLTSSAEAELAREVKEATCRVALDPRAAEAEAAEGRAPEERYRLPDGRVLAVGAERFRAPEVLFDPSVAGLEAPGVGVLAAGAVLRAEVDTRAALLGGVLLCGGASKCPGFGARLLREMRGLSPKGSKIRITAPRERELLPWVGGSILAALSSFRGRWVTRAEFEEEGVRVVHKKALG